MTTVSPNKDEVELMRAVIVEANNSLYGSQSYFITTAKGEVAGALGVTDPPDKYHLARKIEELKSYVRKASKAAAMSPVDRLREALERAETLIDLSEQGMIAERKAQYGPAYTSAQEAAIRQTHQQQLKGVRILAAALSSPEPTVGEI